MDHHISELLTLSGNKHRYQYFITILFFVYWLSLTSLIFSLAFLENQPVVSVYDPSSNKTVVESLSYETCDNPSVSYEVVETYKYSWVIDLGIQCEKLKVSLIGTMLSAGSLLGAIFYSFFTKRFGEKNVILVCNAIYFVLMFLTIFVNYYGFFLFTICASSMVMNMAEYSTFIILGSILPKDNKSIFCTFVNSALGVGGMIYVGLYYAFQQWKYVFIVTLSISAVLEVLTILFVVNSLQFFLDKKDYDGLLNALKYIAKFNGRLDMFNKEIETTKYKGILQAIKGGEAVLPTETPRTEFIGTPVQHVLKAHNEKDNDAHNNDKEKIVFNYGNTNSNDINNKGIISSQVELQHIQETPQTTTLNTLANNEDNNTETNTKPNNNYANVKLSAIALFKYKSVRCTFLLLCLLWFCTSALFNGLTIGVKSLPGNIFVNSLLLFAAETPSYYVAGVVMNTKALGRKYSLILFTGGFSLMCLMLVVLFKYEIPTIVFYLITRFCVMTAFCTYYTFCLESYPLSINKIAYGLNGACNSFGGIVIPFIVEYIERRMLYLIYCIVGGVCAGLMVFLKETRGKVIPDQIKEIEEEGKEKIPEVKV